MELLERIAHDRLPDNIGVEWSGLSYQEKQAGGQTGLILGLVFLFVFLFLAALYESWSVPIAVLISLPIAVLGAYAGISICGLENDTYFQIGLVMLIGLAAKNAILIVEFAKDEVDKGGDLLGGPACGSPALPPHPDDVTGLHPRYAAHGVGFGTGFGQPTGHRYRRVLRYDCGRYGRHSAGALLLRDDLQGEGPDAYPQTERTTL